MFSGARTGGSWNPVNTGLTNLDVRALAIDPATPATVYAGTSGGAFAITITAPRVAIATNQSLYHDGDRMVVTVATAPLPSSDLWYLIVALITPVNTPQDPFFIYRFNPVVELLTFQEALARLPAFDQVAARPLSPVSAESVVILDVTLPAGLPGGNYAWAAALFSADLTRTSAVAVAPFAIP